MTFLLMSVAGPLRLRARFAQPGPCERPLTRSVSLADIINTLAQYNAKATFFLCVAFLAVSMCEANFEVLTEMEQTVRLPRILPQLDSPRSSHRGLHLQRTPGRSRQGCLRRSVRSS